MLNRIILISRLTRDPEMKYLATGTPVANFTIAVDRPFTNAEGNRKADFIDCVVWRKLGETPRPLIAVPCDPPEKPKCLTRGSTDYHLIISTPVPRPIHDLLPCSL